MDSGLYKDIYVDAVCLGETAPGVFFYTEVEGNQNHIVATESEFSPNQTKDLYVDGVCLGETAPGAFFYTEVEGGKEHTFATESEFGTIELKIFTEAGKNYFFEQFVTWGMFVYGADIRQVTEAEGKQIVQSYQQAIPGTCSNQ